MQGLLLTVENSGYVEETGEEHDRRLDLVLSWGGGVGDKDGV